MKRISITKELYRQPVFMAGDAVEELIATSLDSSMDNQDDGDDPIQEPDPKNINDYYMVIGNIGIVCITGVIMKGVQPDDDEQDFTDLNIIGNVLDDCMSNPEVQSVLIYCNSPGGFLPGVAKVAEQVYTLSQVKPTYAYVDGGYCASACYYIASQANAIYASDDSQIGSIGDFKILLNRVRMMEQQGIDVEVYSAGEDKMMYSPLVSRTPEQKARIQAEVDKVYEEFKATVTRARPNIDFKTIGARVYNTTDSLKYGLIDGIVDNVAECLGFINTVKGQ